MTLLELDDLSKSYGAVAALDGVTLAVAEGSRTAVVGPSGSGKSTLLRLVAGFEAADRGRIVLGGETVADGCRGVPAHRRGIGIVAQDGALFPHLSVADNIGFGLDRGARDRAERVRELMGAVELDPAMGARRPHELSGGQQQRVALARALARRPRLMLLDEPFSALDAGLREATRAAVAGVLGQFGIACILVTHDHAEALSFADRVAVLEAGRLVQAGAPRELYWRPRDARAAAFLGETVLLPGEVRGGSAACRLGRVPVAPGTAPGPAEIMLRPEQIRLEPAAPGEALDDAGALGEVTAVAFGGTLSSVTVALPAGGGSPAASLVLKTSGADLPQVGARVRLSVTGTAHVFARPSARPPARCAADEP